MCFIPLSSTIRASVSSSVFSDICWACQNAAWTSLECVCTVEDRVGFIIFDFLLTGFGAFSPGTDASFIKVAGMYSNSASPGMVSEVPEEQ